MIILTILGFLLITFAAVSESIMDKLQFHYDKSIFKNPKYNQLFWNPIESWKNKWKEDLKTEKFIGSSTLFVFTTDAWHLFKFFRNTSLFIGLPLIAIGHKPLMVLLFVVIARILYGLTFTLCFDKLLVDSPTKIG
jgi:hypothetical protein